MAKRARSKVCLTESIARSAATDEGNRSARKAGRRAWSAADYNAAVREFNRLRPARCSARRGRSR